jgi:hypothetical protein
MMNVKDILLDLGYSNIIEGPKDYRMRPIYRESDNNTVLSVKKDTGRFIDFSKGISGSIEDLIKLSLNLKNVEDVKKWVSQRNISIDKKEVERPTINTQKTFDREMLLKLKKDHSYWINRGIPEDVVARFEGGVASSGKMAGRYVFPIFNKFDQIVGFSGRDILGRSEVPKWKHIGNKSFWCFPAKLTLKSIKSKKEVFVVESIGDALALYNAGIDNFIVSFGLEISTAIINFLLKVDVHKIRICFNDDSENNSAGNEASEKAYNKLTKFFDRNQVAINLPSKNDFGEMTTEEITEWKRKI